MNLKSKRGEIVITALGVYIVLGLALAVVGVKLSGIDLFHKAPPTKELNIAQEKLAQAQKEAHDAEERLKWALLDEKNRTTEQVQGAQQYVEGARSSLTKAPKSPEVDLASGLLDRASLGLKRAIGDLPADRQKEILDIVSLALSQKQEEVNRAYVMLAEKDDENNELQAQKLEVEAKIPILEKKAEVLTERVAAAQVVVSAKTNEVAAYANAAHEEKVKAGSLGAFGEKLMKALYILAALTVAFAILWIYAKLKSVSHKTIGTILGDIRSGVDPTTAFDTNLPVSAHQDVKKQAVTTVVANQINP